MITYHQRNISAFKGNHIRYWVGHPVAVVGVFLEGSQINSRVKRFSMLNFADADLLPDVSGSFDQGDRQTLLNTYCGILFAGGAPAGARTPYLTLLGVG